MTFMYVCKNKECGARCIVIDPAGKMGAGPNDCPFSEDDPEWEIED